MEALTGRLRRRFQFYVGPDELPLLEAAVSEHGSVQNAVLAALRAQAAERLRPSPPRADEAPQRAAGAFRAQAPERGSKRRQAPTARPRAASEPSARQVELFSPDAARVLGVTTEAVRSRVERGALAGHRDGTGHWVVELDRELVRGSGIVLEPRGAARLVGLRPGTIKERCKRGVYAGARNDGIGWRIPVEDLL